MRDLLNNCQKLLVELENYHGCGNKIRDALSNSSNNQLQIAAYNEVCPNVELILNFYNISNDIGMLLWPCLLSPPPHETQGSEWGSCRMS
jgi:hypothetical protein